MNLFQILKSDLITCSTSRKITGYLVTLFFDISFQTIAAYRVCHALRKRRQLSFLVRIIQYYSQILSSSQLNPSAVIGRNFRLPHPFGVVIGDGVIIKDNVTIFQHVTLGSHGKTGADQKYPVIGDGVKLFAGATIIGAIQIGPGAVIGAGSVVLEDIPAHAIAAGVPAKILNQKSLDSAELNGKQPVTPGV